MDLADALTIRDAPSGPSVPLEDLPPLSPELPVPPEPIHPISGQSPSSRTATSSTAVATDRPSRPPSERLSQVPTRLSHSTSFSTFVRKAKSINGLSWLGVSFDKEESSQGRTWVIKVTKAGRWFVYLHLIITVVSIFNLITAIYSWPSGAESDVMLQKILTAVSKSGSRLEGLDNEFLKWINATKLRSTEEEARLAEEQTRWNALLKVFEDCGASQSRPNGTDACNNIRHFFKSNPLPHPDKSPIAKRNIAQLDRIIRRVHLGESQPKGPYPGFGHDISFAKLARGIFLWVLIISFCLFGCYVLVRSGKRMLRIYRQYRKESKKEDDKIDEKMGGVEVEDNSIPIIATGGDYLPLQNNLVKRNLRRFDQHAAAARGSVIDLIDNHLSVKVNEIDQNNEYGSLLSAASRSGSLQTVEYVLSRKPDMHLQGGRYHSALQAGAHSGNRSVVQALLRAGARDTSRGGFYGTAVNAAAEKGSAEMLLDLLIHYTDEETIVNYPGGTYGHAVIAAAARGDQKAVEILLSKGALVDQSNATGTTALHQAAANGHLQTIEVLLAWGANINPLSSVYGTPLHAACRGEHAEAAKRLLATEVDVSIKDHRQRLPLHEAAQAKEGLDDVFQEILRLRPDLINEMDADKTTALHLASNAGNTSNVNSLLDAKADCSASDKFQAQPLFGAAGRGHAEVVMLLLRKGNADPNAKNCFGRVALHGPAQTNDVRVQEYLINAKAEVNAIGSDGKTPLHEACNMGRIKNVELLIAHPGIKVNELDNDQFPPLYKALCSSDGNKDYFNKCVNREIVTQLLQRADIDVDVSNGIAVQEAARKGYQTEVETMLNKSKASIQMHGGKYGGVLQAACISGNLSLVNLLLQPDYHADINQQGGEFGCPLAAAAAYGHVAIVRRLLEAGANASVAGIGRYDSPLQSTCRAVDESCKAKEGRKWASVEDQIRSLMREYGAEQEDGDDKRARVGEERYRDWRWVLTPTGWEWIPPGEM
ncbi:hypothetical protein JMJ35_000516 [Cladonia borealis]|uniref:Ankyrin n=1 Tax=Cladonia borealis TaxID=184061 RepID=A0AA39UF90_9LECA|nr:hypothetical protein JMJ35_000516 [Cladonia borealis]